MTKYKLEYVWLDGYRPTANLRGKTMVREFDAFPTLEQLPLWGFDGSSTKQAEGSSSDCVLKPIRVVPDPERLNGAVVLCEVMMPDGVTPHASNTRATILDDADAWFVELSAIVRTYLEGRYEIRAPELTTEEFLQEASRAKELTTEHRAQLSAFLERCDRVKFAGYRPDPAESIATLDAARAFVEDTRLREAKEAA